MAVEWPSGESAGDFPKSGAGEEMGSSKRSNVSWSDEFDRSLIYVIRKLTMPKDRACNGIVFVRVDIHGVILP